jgi:lambda repressor-like predicted transcriptional regulator
MIPWKRLVADFKQRLKERGSTIRDFALEHGYSVHTFRNYLSGESPAPDEVVRLVKEYLR